MNAKLFKNQSSHDFVENQWVNAFDTMVDGENYIISQGSTDIIPDFIGELDLFVVGNVNKGYIITREDNKVMEHLLRKHRLLSPQLFANVKFDTNIADKFSKNAEYLVIDFRNKNFDKLKKYILDKNDKKKIDIAHLKLEQNLMTVVYDDELDYFEVYYQEEFYDKIFLVE